MNETVSLFLSVCALLVVIGGLLAVGAFLLLRVLARWTGGLPIGAFGALGNTLVGDNVEGTDTPVPTRSRRPNPHDLAASLDFDAAVARQSADTLASDVSAQGIQPGSSVLKPGTGDSDRVLRSGHSASSSQSANQQPPSPGPDQGFQRVGGNPSLNDFDSLPDRPLRKRRRRRGDNAGEDELFGGLLDEDGDGDLDFP